MINFDDMKITEKVILDDKEYEIYDLTVGILRDHENNNKVDRFRVIRECSNIPDEVIEKTSQTVLVSIVDAIIELSKPKEEGGDDKKK